MLNSAPLPTIFLLKSSHFCLTKRKQNTNVSDNSSCTVMSIASNFGYYQLHITNV